MQRVKDTAAIYLAEEYLRSMRAETRLANLRHSYGETGEWLDRRITADFLALYSEELDRAREARVVEET